MVVSVPLTAALAAGTHVAAGGQESAWEVPAAARARENPVAVSEAVLERAREDYETRCQMCHGEAGHGDGAAAITFQPAPANIATAEARARLTDGEIFYTISEGRRPMPRLAGRIPDDAIWGLVHYVRHLQASN